MKYIELRKKIENLFKENNVTEFADIDWIMVEILKVSRSMLNFVEIGDENASKIMEIAKVRAKHIPLAYIFGRANFYGRDYLVDENCLIPRLDTEVLIESVLKEIDKRKEKISILDIGTGSGAIAITLKKERNCEVLAVDVNAGAIEIAKKNAKINDANVGFVVSNLFDNIINLKFDFIVSNPPYIETATIDELDEEVAKHEPILALDGGVDGLDFYRKIIADAPKHLNKFGMIFFEIGYNQANAVKELLKKDFEDIEIVKDYGENDRVVFAKLR